MSIELKLGDTDITDSNKRILQPVPTQFDEEDQEHQNKRQKIQGHAPTEEQVKSWLGGMDRDEAVDFIANLAATNGEVLDAVQKLIRDDPTFTKLFVRSLDWKTSAQSLKEAFTQFGEVADCVVVVDNITQKSKGFGFVTFEDVASAQLALTQTTWVVDEREVKCHLASERSEKSKSVQHKQTASFSAPSVDLTSINTVETKLFVHGLAWETSTATLKWHFEQYGPVAEAAVIHDKSTGKSKGFGFVTYFVAEHAQNALRNPQKSIDGRTIGCHLAADRDQGREAKFISSGVPPVLNPVTSAANIAAAAAVQQHQTHALQGQIMQLQQQLQQQAQQIGAMVQPQPQYYQHPQHQPAPH